MLSLIGVVVFTFCGYNVLFLLYLYAAVVIALLVGLYFVELVLSCFEDGRATFFVLVGLMLSFVIGLFVG